MEVEPHHFVLFAAVPEGAQQLAPYLPAAVHVFRTDQNYSVNRLGIRQVVNEVAFAQINGELAVGRAFFVDLEIRHHGENIFASSASVKMSGSLSNGSGTYILGIYNDA